MNHERYLEILRALTPEQRLQKAWELTETTRMLFRAGLRHRFPHLPEEELQRFYVRELHKCRNNDCRIPCWQSCGGRQCPAEANVSSTTPYTCANCNGIFSTGTTCGSGAKHSALRKVGN